MTEYRILRSDPEISAYVDYGFMKASNPKQALRLLNESGPVAAGKYVAVPTSNWHELEPEVKTETRLVF